MKKLTLEETLKNPVVKLLFNFCNKHGYALNMENVAVAIIEKPKSKTLYIRPNTKKWVEYLEALKE